MGIGDELMCTGEARRSQERDPRPVAFRGKDGRARWHPIWDHNPRISRTGEGAQWVDNRSGLRPYIRGFDRRRFLWVDRYDCPRGEIYLTPQEQQFGAQYFGRIVIEPNLKVRDGQNKDWGWKNWQALVDQRPDLPWTQLGPPQSQRLASVEFVETTDFRLAAAVIAAARACVLPEGGLHHAAAAFQKPAVVIFGGFISPRQTGYPEHRNLFTGREPCGWRVPCAHCQAAMRQITVSMVRQELEAIL